MSALVRLRVDVSAAFSFTFDKCVLFVCYRLCRCNKLNMMSAMAARMPAMQSAVMQAKSGSDTVRSSFTTTVRSGGTLPPVTTGNKFV